MRVYQKVLILGKYLLREKCSGHYFPIFGLNTEIYGVNLRVQSEYGKIRTRKNSIFGHFSRSDFVHLYAPVY